MNKQIDYIIDHFNFGKVHKAMKAVHWTWFFCRIPKESDLRKCARELLEDAAKMDVGYSTGTGGFVAAKYEDKDGPYLGLMFRFAVARGYNE